MRNGKTEVLINEGALLFAEGLGSERIKWVVRIVILFRLYFRIENLIEYYRRLFYISVISCKHTQPFSKGESKT